MGNNTGSAGNAGNEYITGRVSATVPPGLCLSEPENSNEATGYIDRSVQSP
jgi:hypothetical protein